MKIRSIGSLLLAALLGCSSSSGSDPDIPLPPLQARWINQNRLPTSSHLRAVRFINPNQGIVAGEGTAIFRTDTGGATWYQEEHLPFTRGGDIAAMDMVGAELHAVGSDVLGGRVWTTTNAIDWATPDVDSTPPPFTALDVVTAGEAYYLRQDGAIRHVAGSTVTNLSTGAAGTWLTIDIAWPTLIGWTGGAAGLLYKTVDGGTNWAPQTLPASAAGMAVRDLTVLFTTIAFACGDLNVIFTGDGTLWTDVTGNLPAGIALRGIHFPLGASVGWVVGTAPGGGGGIWKTSTGGTTWTQQGVGATPFDLHDVWFVDDSNGWAVGDFGTVLKTNDGGTTWTNVTQGNLYQLNAADFTQDGQRGLAVGNGGVALRTLDGGTTWTALALGVGVDLLGVSIPSMGSGEVAYVCGLAGTLYKTSTFGTPVPTWSAQTAPAVTLRAIHFPTNEFMGYCAGDTGTLLKTQDGGITPTSWVQMTVPGPAADYHSISSSFSGLTMLVGGTNGKIAHTDTAGGTWNDFTIPGQAGVTIRSIQSPTAADVFALGSNGTLHRAVVITGTPSIVAWNLPPVTAPGGTPNAIAFTSTSNGWSADTGIRYTENGASTAWSVSGEHTNWTLRALWMSQNVTGLGYAVGDNGTILKTTTGGK